MKALEYLKVGIVAVILWMVYKLFIQDKEEPGEVTPNNSGLSSDDVMLFNKVRSILLSNIPQVDYYLIPNIGAVLNTSKSEKALELSKVLAQVQDKPLFAHVYQERFKSTLMNHIIDCFGDLLYTQISNNTPGFDQFFN